MRGREVRTHGRVCADTLAYLREGACVCANAWASPPGRAYVCADMLAYIGESAQSHFFIVDADDKILSAKETHPQGKCGCVWTSRRNRRPEGKFYYRTSV